ncbi:MAG: hypothetical protein QM809_13815 [Gordonia sp. (in: high G+C Gram-positive bacteria)]|uniref:hypothetical protein n=1 Tax=Gordonia sp. (in: high G+C Gram-positive bacteria) TaxID=84139 RepID=UPI0039E591AD
MNDDGGRYGDAARRADRRGRAWGPDRVTRIRAELLGGYRGALRRLERDRRRLPDRSGSLLDTMMEAAELVVDACEPVWFAAGAVEEFRADLRRPAPTADLLGAGSVGFLLFERPITRTTHGAAGRHGTAPVFGVLWWSAYTDGRGVDLEADAPNLLVMHLLSTEISPEFPWPEVWDDSTLSDIGITLVALGGADLPAHAEADDLAPLHELLLSYGAAVREGRIPAA